MSRYEFKERKCPKNLKLVPRGPDCFIVNEPTSQPRYPNPIGTICKRPSGWERSNAPVPTTFHPVRGSKRKAACEVWRAYHTWIGDLLV